MLGKTDGDAGFNGGADSVERIGEIRRTDRQPQRVHAAADINADRGRNDGRLGGNHRAHCGADSGVHIRHGRNMAMHDGQLRHIDELLQGFALDVLRPDFDRHAAFVQGQLNAHVPSSSRKQKTLGC